MSTDRDTPRIVRSWLEDGVTALPDRVLDAVLDELPATPQRRATRWPARRFSTMSTNAKFGLGVAAAALVAVVGFSIFTGQNVGGLNPGDGPEATPGPTAPADPNAYLITNDEGVRVTLTMPEEGWVRLGWFVNNGGDLSTSLTAIQIWTVGNVFTDPCQWSGALADPPVGPTVDDLVVALENQPTRDATTSDVTLDGYRGTLVKMTVPADISFADCDGGQFYSWEGRYHQGPGQHDDVYIVDVEGTRLVIDALYYPDSPAEDRAELQRMLDTIQIEPPA